MRSAAALLATIAGLTAAGGSSAAADPWKALQRPLEIPKLTPGSACPVSSVAHSVPWKRFGVGSGLGRGPAYPVLGGDTLELQPPAIFESRRWGGRKVFWFALPRTGSDPRAAARRAALRALRARRGPAGGAPDRPRPSVYWYEQPDRSRGVPSYTRLRAPGCYGYQIDGTRFSRVVVFRAKRGQ